MSGEPIEITEARATVAAALGMAHDGVDVREVHVSVDVLARLVTSYDDAHAALVWLGLHAGHGPVEGQRHIRAQGVATRAAHGQDWRALVPVEQRSAHAEPRRSMFSKRGVR